jgi:methyl-accepting chemotaxis protein
MNGYVKLYGFYPLMLAVDLEGRVIAVNDRDAAGKPINTVELYQKNFKDAAWFKETLAGNFLKSATLDGTRVEDVSFNDEVAKVTGTDGLSLAFSAPIFDPSGKIIGVWLNRASFSFVEEIIAANYLEFKRRGMASTEFNILDRQGNALLSYDPRDSGNTAITHDRAVLLKHNPAAAGDAAAQAAQKGESGFMETYDNEQKDWHVVYYSASKGALGFPGLKWSMLISIHRDEAQAGLYAAHHQAYWVIGLSLAALVGVAYWLGRSLSMPIFAALESIRQAGESVAATSVQISGASNALAEGSTEQAASLEETAASIEEMSSMTKGNVGHTQQAKTITAETRQAADTGAGRMQAMQTAMQEIQNASQDITKILKTIDEIAFQTNILALNAAVEAARAGEAGMGFAVVAEEVRNLAQRCAAAAKETATKIDDSVAKSQQGVAISTEVAQSFASIQAQIQTLDGLVNQIATASTEQNEGISQVNIAVSEVDKVTQSNAAVAEECAAAVVELSREAEGLTQTVGQLLRLVGGRRAHDSIGRGSQPQPGGRRKIDRDPVASAPAPKVAAPLRPAPKAAPTRSPATAPKSPDHADSDAFFK